LDRQEQRNGTLADRAGDGINRHGIGEQETGGGRTNYNAGSCGRAGRCSCCLGRTIGFGTAEWNAKTDVGQRTKF
jgi:hypothetical protein